MCGAVRVRLRFKETAYGAGPFPTVARVQRDVVVGLIFLLMEGSGVRGVAHYFDECEFAVRASARHLHHRLGPNLGLARLCAAEQCGDFR